MLLLGPDVFASGSMPAQLKWFIVHPLVHRAAASVGIFTGKC